MQVTRMAVFTGFGLHVTLDFQMNIVHFKAAKGSCLQEIIVVREDCFLLLHISVRDFQTSALSLFAFFFTLWLVWHNLKWLLCYRLICQVMARGREGNRARIE